MNKKIIFSGGGTGGHILPAINLMKHFFDKKYNVLLVTDNRGNNFIKENSQFKSYILNTDTPTDKNLIKKFFSYILIFFAIIKSVFIIKKEKPDLIFGLGGYVSFPICLASRFFDIPLIIYENNMVFGRANSFLSSFSKKILIANKVEKYFPEKHKNKTFEVGSILNKNIINYSNLKEHKNKEEFVILVLGGSQGAEVFANVIPSVIKMIKESGHKIEINQQCTKKQKNYLIDFYNKNEIKNYIFEFDKNILEIAKSAKLAITRCGSSTTAELVYALTPFIAVPLPHSTDNHQYLNAKYYEQKGCCWVLEQKDLNKQNLFNLIKKTIENKNKLQNISENMKKNIKRKVYEDVEKEIKELI
tara:strand:+ start:926 stop:2005 length:1080 start_codon:yes stop_codon:yes gene_type:complete